MQSATGAASAATAISNRSRERLLLAFTLAVAFVTYLPTLRYGWVLDDPALIVNNPRIQSVHYLPAYFAEQMWVHISAHDATNYYHPLLLTWYLVQYLVFGLRPWAWHLIVILQHLMATALVYAVVHKLVPRTTTAAIAALLFAVHPVHVETVAWVCGGSESFYSIFFLGSLLAYLLWNGTRRTHWMVTAIALYLLAALSKENAIVLPAVVFVHAWTFRNRSHSAAHGFRSAILRAGCFLPVAALCLAARTWALHGLTHTVTPIPAWPMILTWPSMALVYLRHLVFPVGLAEFYDVPYAIGFSVGQVLLPALFLAAVAGGIWYWGRRTPVVHFAALWSVISLLPFFELRALPWGEIVKDRYLYLPCVGFAIVATLALERLGTKQPSEGIFLRTVSATAIVAAIFCFGSAYYSLFWADDLSLNTRGVAIAPHNLIARNNLGNALAAKGDDAGAAALYRQVLADEPRFALTMVNLAELEYRHGNYAETEHLLTRAIAIYDEDSNEYLYLGLAKFKQGRGADGIADVRRALAMSPNARWYHYSLGFMLAAAGDCDGARAEYEAELRIQPGNATVLRKLADCSPPTK